MPGKSGSHMKEPVSDIFYSLYIESFLNSDENSVPKYLRFESVKEISIDESSKKKSKNCSSKMDLTVLVSNPYPEYVLKNVKTDKVVVSVTMASELIWKAFAAMNIRKETRFYPKHENLRNRSIRAHGTHIGSIIDIHKKLNKVYDGIKKSFIETQLYFYLAKGVFDPMSIAETIRIRFENFSRLSNLIIANSIFEVKSGKKLKAGTFRFVDISDDDYLKILNKLFFNGDLKNSSGDVSSDLINESSSKILNSKKDKIDRRLYDDRYAVIEWTGNSPTEISSLFSNFDPLRIVIDRRLHKIVLTDTMIEELTWLNAPPPECQSNCTEFLFSSFTNYFTGFSLAAVERSLKKLRQISVFVDIKSTLSFKTCRKNYFLPKIESKISAVRTRDVRKRLIGEIFDPESQHMIVDGKYVINRFSSSNRWLCESKYETTSQEVRNCRDFVLRRDFEGVFRMMYEFFYGDEAERSLNNLMIWRLSVFFIQNIFNNLSVDERFEKIYALMDLMLDSATRANAWRMFSEVFSMNLSFGRTSAAEQMSSILVHKKLSKSRKSKRKLIETYLALIYCKNYLDEYSNNENFKPSLIKITKTVDVLLSYGPEFLDTGRLTNLCAVLLSFIDDADEDESVSIKNIELEKHLVEYLTEKPFDSSAFTSLVVNFPDNSLIENLIEKHSSLSCVPKWCQRRIKSGQEINFGFLFKLLFEFLDHNSNKNSKKTWRLVKKLLIQDKIREYYRTEIIDLWSARRDWWKLFHLNSYESEKNSLFVTKKFVISLLSRLAGDK